MKVPFRCPVDRIIPLLLTCIAARLLADLAVDQHYSYTGWDLRGILSDTVICMIISTLSGFIGNRAFIQLLLILWASAHAGNIAHIEANYSNLDVANAGYLSESEFVNEAILTWTFLKYWLYMVTVAELSHAMCRKFLSSRHLSGVTSVILVLIGIIVLALLPVKGDYWRQYHFLEESFDSIVSSAEPQQPVSPKTRALYERMTGQDISGELVINTPTHKKPNILIITIEGLSNTYIEQGVMPHLEALAKKSLYYPNFINPHQYTYNGLFAILCGDYSSFEGQLSAIHRKNKWYATLNNTPLHPCLPVRLKNKGYYSEFYQGSSLSFTRKDRFMKRIGFNREFEAKNLLDLYDKDVELKRSFIGWGVDDAHLFEMVTKRLIEINKEKSPWFATVMTTGTHWPYQVSDDYAAPFESKKQAAYHFTDTALNKMLAELEASGILDNTLLFISGDETHLPVSYSKPETMPAGNWGLLVVRTPDHDTLSSTDYFIQPDILISILDYLGDGVGKAQFRSVFRHYEQFRPVMFSGNLSGRWIAIPDPNHMILCRVNFFLCRTYGVEGDIFHAKVSSQQTSDESKLYIAVARFSDSKLPKYKTTRVNINYNEEARIIAVRNGSAIKRNGRSADKDRQKNQTTPSTNEKIPVHNKLIRKRLVRQPN